MIKKIVTIVLLVVGSIVNAQDENTFKNANELYNTAKFSEAITAYESIIASGQESVALYYNLANAYYKLNKIASSIYYYEKALVLDPSDVDVKNNLKFAQNATIDHIEILPQGIVKKISNQITNFFGFDSWARLSVVGILLFVVLFIAYYTSGSTFKKRIFFLSSWSFAVLGLITMGFAFKQYNFVQNKKHAIIFAEETVVKSEPNLRSEEAFVLHEGTKVAVLEGTNDWKKIKLVDGKIGWIPAEDLKEL